jgi:DNA-binding transcriptional MerR regulator
VRFRVYRPIMKSLATNEPGALRIGDVATSTGVTVESLRYYEQRGLLRPSGRKASGYRVYPDSAIALVRFIKRAQSLGFTLAEVEELVRLRERAWSGDAPRVLREVAVTKLRDIDRRVRELQALRGALATLIEACDVACAPIIDSDRRGTDRGTTMAPLACPLIEAFDTEHRHDVSADEEIVDRSPCCSQETRGSEAPEREATRSTRAPATTRTPPRRKR